MIYGYIRVSTDKQTTENQFFEIEQFALKNNITIDCWIKETISATKKLEQRKLGHLLKKLQKGDILVSTELSRLGRNLLQVRAILSYCMNIGCQVWTIKDNYRLGADIQSKVLAFAFSFSAEIERALISSRTKEALARVKKDGKRLGRPVGSLSKNKLENQEEKLNKLRDEGLTVKDIARNLKCGRGTIYRFLHKNMIDF